MRIVGIAFHVALLAFGCSPTEFDTDACNDLAVTRSGGVDTPWRVDEGDVDGPRFIEGSVEWRNEADTSCEYDLLLRFRVEEGAGTVNEASVNTMIVFSSFEGELDTYSISVGSPTSIDREADGVVEVIARGCVDDVSGLDYRRGAFTLKLLDDGGRESDAFCARTFAAAGTELPNKESQRIRDVGDGV
jgi:hypothetical protein